MADERPLVGQDLYYSNIIAAMQDVKIKSSFALISRCDVGICCADHDTSEELAEVMQENVAHIISTQLSDSRLFIKSEAKSFCLSYVFLSTELEFDEISSYRPHGSKSYPVILA
ncbi:hypothetical protein MUK42_35148 [Musa troglodytarum]|uniref:Uncharacterized protein n=1 Tax=Musa troglodytarum TaxID=320322 RepID=A0A9E7E9T6_9LILI|nr:hypothetical protein MUK42_35148 [Musa troglodytarum]